MPHITLEYSVNIAQSLNAKELLQKLHDEVAAHDIKTYKIKSRLRPMDEYIVGDGSSDNSMLHVTLLILPGRGKDFASTLGQAMFNIMKNYIKEQGIKKCFLTQEMREMDADLYYRYKTEDA